MIGSIYKIIVNQSNDIYIGSTFNELRHRWQEHKYQYNHWKKCGKTSKTSLLSLIHI